MMPLAHPRTAPAFSADDLRARLAARPLPGASADGGDHVLNPALETLGEPATAREAAVLVPVVDRLAGATVILTTRSSALRRHSGQIAFPGGVIDPGDASPEAAALREAFEEIGLDPACVETLARLPAYRTTTGFRITPVVGVVEPGARLLANPAEVDDIFEVPLGFLMNAANHARGSRTWQGHERVVREPGDLGRDRRHPAHALRTALRVRTPHDRLG